MHRPKTITFVNLGEVIVTTNNERFRLHIVSLRGRLHIVSLRGRLHIVSLRGRLHIVSLRGSACVISTVADCEIVLF